MQNKLHVEISLALPDVYSWSMHGNHPKVICSRSWLIRSTYKIISAIKFQLNKCIYQSKRFISTNQLGLHQFMNSKLFPLAYASPGPAALYCVHLILTFMGHGTFSVHPGMVQRWIQASVSILFCKIFILK